MRITDEASQVIGVCSSSVPVPVSGWSCDGTTALGSLELTVPATDAPGASAARTTLRESAS